jgi:cyclomaltodextrinase
MAAWYDKAVFYHLYPLGACGCAKENDYQVKESKFDILNQYIEHMSDMGFNAVYIGPLFESATHGYDTTDYKKIDSRLGTNDEFKQWVKDCHAKGIKVVVDGVFNHTGRDFFAFQDLKAKKWDSFAKDWYCWVDFNQNGPFSDGFSYESWRGFAILPKLNMQNQAVRDYMLDVARFWISEFDIDGIRLDCADVLDFEFMKQLRHVTTEMKQDFWLMGEVIHGDYGRWVNPEMLHSVTNYELHKGIFSAHNSHNYFEMAHSIMRLFGPYGLCKGANLYNFVDNHDVDRIYNKLTNPKDLVPVYTFLYTIVGIPSVYYGSEFGIEGCKAGGSDDPLRPMLEPKTYVNKHPELTELLKKLAGLKKDYEELCLGEYKELLLQNRHYAYARVYNGQTCITVLSNDDAPKELWIPLPMGGTTAIDLLHHQTAEVVNGQLHLTIQGHDGAVIKIR